MRASLGLNDCGAENQVTAITAFDRPWSAFVLFVPVCLFVVRQAPPKLTPKAPAATFKSRAWDSQQSQLSACPSSQSFAAAQVGVICAARKLMLFMQRSAAGLTQNVMRMPPMGVVLLWLIDMMEDATT
jgi:hypothetical protein